MHETQKTVVVCPLDWGLGHATRMVPVIELLLRFGARVVIAADNRPLAFLKQRFPEGIFEKLPGYTPKYPRYGALMPLVLMTNYPLMMMKARAAQNLLLRIVKKYQAGIVISDNRYELSIPGVYSIFVTHQLHIQTNGWQKLFKSFITSNIKAYLNRYDEVWIPDFAGTPNLSGMLSHPPINIKLKQSYVGLLSRFAQINCSPGHPGYDIVVLISGPEPQRSLLENKLTKQALSLDIKALIIKGQPENSEEYQQGNVHFLSHANDHQIAEFIAGAGLVISRPGYSTLMDLAFLQKKAACIPTPGQTEQLYLANKLMEEKMAYCDSQKNFNLQHAFETRNLYTGLPLFQHDDTLQMTINRILTQQLLPKKEVPDERR
ncbi:MAG: glycosyltransferase [Bacteroidales bacterium]|jgi:hypothetical protein